MSKLGQVMLLPYDVKVLTEQYYPAIINSLEYTFNKIQLAFTRKNISGQWGSFNNHINSQCISSLSMVSELLNNKLETKQIERDTLDELRDKVELIIDEVRSSDLRFEFKRLMQHHLQRIFNAIDDYFISGAMPILDAVEATVGHIVLDPQFKEDLKDTAVGEKMRQLIACLADVATVATAATGAIAYISSAGIPLIS